MPSSRARRVAADLAEFGRVRRAYLGVTIRQLDPLSAERLGSNAAALITGVTAPSPASEGGLVAGDVILAVDGRPIEGPGSLQAMIEVAKVDEPMMLTISRSGKSSVIAVRPVVQPDRFNPPTQAFNPPTQGSQSSGININVPGARINVPGPSLNIGPTATPPLDNEPALNPLPPALPAPGTTEAAPQAPKPGEKPIIRSTPTTPEPASPIPGPSVHSTSISPRIEPPQALIIAARRPD